MAEKIRLRIGDLNKAVLVTGQAYQDPKDALNEFVSNAADEYAQADMRGARIRVLLRRKAKRPIIAIEDSGRGMPPERLKQVAQSLFKSVKVGDPSTVGEKAIGVLAFQQLGGRCDIYSRTADSPDTFVLRLQRGSAQAELRKAEPHRRRNTPGTTVYLADLDPDVLRVLTRRKVVDYLRRRRGAALQRGDYSIEVAEGRSSELVTPEVHDGIHLDIPARDTLWGRIEFALYVAPRPDRHRRVAVVGAGGTTILDDLCEIEELAQPPWDTDQVSGMVGFDALQQTAGRRAVLRDREAFPVFLEAIASVEPAVMRTIERVNQEVDQQTAERMAEAVRKIFGKVLRELEDVDNPMRTLVGSAQGEGALFEEESQPAAIDTHPESTTDEPEPPEPSVADLAPPGPASDPIAPEPPAHAAADRGRQRSLPDLAPDPSPDGVRSRYEPDERIVYYNDQHPDYLSVMEDEPTLLEYLSMLVAKELVVYNNPRVEASELGEELVRMLVRVRRHIPRRR